MPYAIFHMKYRGGSDVRFLDQAIPESGEISVAGPV
jgi:hypothetical protein